MSLLLTSAYVLVGMALAISGLGLLIVLRRRRRKSRFAEYGWVVDRFQLETDGIVEFAQWLHPKERRKSFTQQQVDALREYVHDGDTVIDVGAYSGDTALPLALAAGKSGCVLALEPNRYVFKVLQQNAALNREKTNIVPLNFAATSEDGTFTFHYGDGSYCNGGFVSQLANKRHGHPYKLDVQGKNLTAFLRREYPERLSRLSLIKVDAEGYDAQVLASLRDILLAYRPDIICEVYKKLSEAERNVLFDVLHAAGYECFKLGDQQQLRGESVSRADVNRWKHFDILALPKQAAQRAAA